MTTPYYTIAALSPTAAEIYLYGQIGENDYQESVTARALVAELATLTGKALTVYLNSPGGSVMDAAAIYSALNRHTMPVSIVVDGWALSAASLIAMAGKTLTMGVTSLLMLHNPSMISYGNADQLRQAAAALDAVRQTMINAYAAKTGADEATISAWLDAETWFDADAAIAAKLAEGKTDQTAPPAPAPTAAKFHNLPAAYAAYLPSASQDRTMTNQNPPETPVTPPETPAAPPPAPVPDAPVALSAADIKAQISAVIAAERQAERKRQSDIRASYATFLKKMPLRAEALTALQEQVLADGSSPQEADHKLLELLGSFSEPLAAGQGNTEYTGTINPLDVGSAARAYQQQQKAAGRTISMTDAVAHILKEAA